MSHAWDAIVCDESHRMKGRDTKQSKAVRRFKGRRRFLLTGTPVKNEITDLWPQLQFLEPEKWTSYWKFFDRYVAWKEGFFGKEITGTRNAEELRERIAGTMLARTIDDVDLQLPPLVRRRVTVDLSKAQRTAYDQMRDEFIAEMTGNDDDVVAANWLTQVLRLKQIAGALGIFSSHNKDSAKIDALMELMDEASDTEKWVVMSQFRTVVDETTARLREADIPYCEMTGQSCQAWMPGPGGFHQAADRSQLIDWFQRSDKPRVFIATTQTGGEGITLTAARRFVFLDLMWTPADNEQALKRIHRYGQDRTCFIYEVLARNTVDFSAILPTLRKKQDVIDAVMNPKEPDDDAV
jgi:SNF2 family DNA or RNA helicase